MKNCSSTVKLMHDSKKVWDLSILNFLVARERSKAVSKEYEKAEDDLKALQSVGQV